MRLLGALSIPIADVHVNAPETADLDILEVADVRKQYCFRICHCFAPVRVYTVDGSGFSASMPYFLIACATTLVSILPSSQSAFSAATAI